MPTYTHLHTVALWLGRGQWGGGQGQVMDRWQTYNSSFIVCSNNYACVAFVSQNPDKKKVLTSQRTFDSEGEKNPSVWHLSLTLFCLAASNNKAFFWISQRCPAEEELYQHYKEKALHNDSDEDADSREPKPDNGIVVQYRPIRTSWSQLSVVRKNSYIFLILSLHPVYWHSYCIHSLTVESWNASALKNAVISSLATVQTHPPTVGAFLCPLRWLSGSTGAYLLGLWFTGRQSHPDVQEVLVVLRGLMPMCWQALRV